MKKRHNSVKYAILFLQWMMLYTNFNSISVISQQQLTLFMSLLGSTSARLWLWSVLPKDTSKRKPRGSSASRIQSPWIMIQTLYHQAMQQLFLQKWKSEVQMCVNYPNSNQNPCWFAYKLSCCRVQMRLLFDELHCYKIAWFALNYDFSEILLFSKKLMNLYVKCKLMKGSSCFVQN